MNFQWIELYSIKDAEDIQTIDLPTDRHILAITIKGIKTVDEVRIEGDMETIFEGTGNFNCGHYFINLDPRHFHNLQVKITLAGKRKKIIVTLFREKL